jgi:capsular polysaccharide biosynthesis protein
METARSTATRMRPRRVLVISIAAGLLVASLVMLLGVAYLDKRKTHYEATSSVVVLPDSTLSAADSVSALDSLSRGQVVATFARVLGGKSLTTSALDSLGVNRSERAGISSDFHPVPATSLISITVSAPTARVAENVAGQVADEAARTRESLQPLFVASVVDRGAGSAVLVGTSTSTILLAFVVVAIVGGLVTQQLVFQGVTLLAASAAGRARRNSGASLPDDTNEEPGPAEPPLANGASERGHAEPAAADAASERAVGSNPWSWGSRPSGRRTRVAEPTDTRGVAAGDTKDA